jgi:YHS domain-containing protein
MNRISNIFIATLLLASAVAIAEQPTTKRYLNVDRHGLALQGYDPVAYFTDKKPVEGDKHISSTYQGATYYFSTGQHKQVFDADPAKYEPQFGGFCAYAVSQNSTASIGPEFWSIIDGRLFLQHNQKAVNLWNQDIPGHLKDADKNWPGINDKNGK